MEFSEVYDNHQKQIYNYFIKQGLTPETAADFTQDTFLKAYEKYPHYIPSAPVTNWLFKIAKNHLLDYYRHEKTVKNKQSILEATYPHQVQDSQAECLVNETCRKIRRTLSHLPRSYAQVLVLHHGYGMSLSEIADRLSETLPAVKLQAFKGRNHFRTIWTANT